MAGGFGAGKTTLVGSISEVRPLRTEENLTSAGVGYDNLNGVEAKTTTTVAMDFGRITLNQARVLYLFGTPGQERFWFMWDDLCFGALGAVVAGRHPAAGRLLRVGGLLRKARAAVRRRHQLLRRRGSLRS